MTPITKQTTISVGLLSTVGTLFVGGILWMNSVDATAKYNAKDMKEHKQDFKEHQNEVQRKVNKIDEKIDKIEKIVIRIEERMNGTH